LSEFNVFTVHPLIALNTRDLFKELVFKCGF
jgi:hypothetical protein